MSPITVNTRIEDLLRNRKTKVQSWYFDLTTVMNYWGKERTYHHTPPISLIYALHEAMRIVLEEGLEAGWERHRQNQAGADCWPRSDGHRAVRPESCGPPADSHCGDDSQAESMDRKCAAECSMSSTSKSPAGWEITKRTIWRIGLMGYSSQRANVLLFLDVLESVLLDQGLKLPVGAGIAAAAESLCACRACA